jgi:hypothetical protein
MGKRGIAGKLENIGAMAAPRRVRAPSGADRAYVGRVESGQRETHG